MAMDLMTPFLIVILIIAFFFIYLMNVRIKQLKYELDDLKSRVLITDEELTRLSQDIEDFKKINI
jgi:cell division protein FtsL